MIEYGDRNGVRYRRIFNHGKGEMYFGGVLLGTMVPNCLLEIEKPRGGLTQQQSPERRKLSRGIISNSNKEDV